jgi:hypothetical protein
MSIKSHWCGSLRGVRYIKFQVSFNLKHCAAIFNIITAGKKGKELSASNDYYFYCYFLLELRMFSFIFFFGGYKKYFWARGAEKNWQQFIYLWLLSTPTFNVYDSSQLNSLGRFFGLGWWGYTLKKCEIIKNQDSEILKFKLNILKKLIIFINITVLFFKFVLNKLQN